MPQDAQRVRGVNSGECPGIMTISLAEPSMQVDHLVLGLSFKAAMYYEAHVLEGSLSADISGKYLCDDPRTLPKPEVAQFADIPGWSSHPPWRYMR